MKASELVAQLQGLIAEHGDLDVLTPSFQEEDYDPVRVSVGYARKKKQHRYPSGAWQERGSRSKAAAEAAGFRKCVLIDYDPRMVS